MDILHVSGVGGQRTFFFWMKFWWC